MQCMRLDNKTTQHKNIIIAHQNWHEVHIAIIYPHQDKYIIASYLHYAKHHQTIHHHQKSCIHKSEAFINNINIIITSSCTKTYIIASHINKYSLINTLSQTLCLFTPHHYQLIYPIPKM